jgi:hypothetical protein
MKPGPERAEEPLPAVGGDAVHGPGAAGAERASDAGADTAAFGSRPITLTYSD